MTENEVTIDKKDIRETGDCFLECYECPNCKEVWIMRRNKFCSDCGSLINWK